VLKGYRNKSRLKRDPKRPNTRQIATRAQKGSEPVRNLI